MTSGPVFPREIPVTSEESGLILWKSRSINCRSDRLVRHTSLQPVPIFAPAAGMIPARYRWAEGVTFGFSLPHWNFNPKRTLVGRLT